MKQLWDTATYPPERPKFATITTPGEDVEQQEPSFTPGRNAKLSSREGFYSSVCENVCDTIWWIHVIINLPNPILYITKSEPYGKLDFVWIWCCQCRFINCQQKNHFLGGFVEVGSNTWGISATFLLFSCEPKTLLKLKSIFNKIISPCAPCFIYSINKIAKFDTHSQCLLPTLKISTCFRLFHIWFLSNNSFLFFFLHELVIFLLLFFLFLFIIFY